MRKSMSQFRSLCILISLHFVSLLLVERTIYILKIKYFHLIGPLGGFGLVVAMSVHGWLCLSPSHATLQGEERRSQGSKAVSHRGISTLKNVHHYNCGASGSKSIDATYFPHRSRDSVPTVCRICKRQRMPLTCEHFKPNVYFFHTQKKML